MKLGISISDSVARGLRDLAKAHHANASAVIEAALTRFIALSAVERDRAVRETQGAKTRTGWMCAFWDALAEEFDRNDFARGDSSRIYAPRNYAGFELLFLVHSTGQSESDKRDFIVHIAKTARNEPPVRDIQYFGRLHSVYDAAKSVASRLKQLRGGPS